MIPRDAPPYFTPSRLAVFQSKLLYAGYVTSCRWRTPVRAAVFCRTPSEVGGRSKLRPSRHGGHAGLSAVAFGEGGTRDPTDVATGPAAGCPPVCQRTISVQLFVAGRQKFTTSLAVGQVCDFYRKSSGSFSMRSRVKYLLSRYAMSLRFRDIWTASWLR